MNIATNGHVLAAATKDLQRKWQQTKETWQDAKSAQFEEDFLAELFNSVEKASALMEQLDKLVTRVENDCE